MLREKLLLEGNREDDEALAQYKSEITAAFRNLQRLRTFNLDRLSQEKPYHLWESSRASCMMLVHGRTAATKTGYSWLSPAVLQLVAQLRAQNQRVIFGLSQVEPFMEKDVPAYAVLSSLISQLLEANASILRDDIRYQKLSRTFCDPAWRAHLPKMPFAVLQELLNLSPDMYILLDRVDRIRGEAYGFMNSMVSLIKDCKSRIKILLIASSNGYDRVGGKYPEELQESVEEDLGSERFWSLEMNQ